MEGSNLGEPRPSLLDMPTFWARKFTDTGHDEVIAMFWTHEFFDPEETATCPEDV